MDLLGSFDFVNWITIWGPPCVKFALLGLLVYHAWNRNLWKMMLFGGSWIVTVILGW